MIVLSFTRFRALLKRAANAYASASQKHFWDGIHWNTTAKFWAFVDAARITWQIGRGPAACVLMPLGSRSGIRALMARCHSVAWLLLSGVVALLLWWASYCMSASNAWWYAFLYYVVLPMCIHPKFCWILSSNTSNYKSLMLQENKWASYWISVCCFVLSKQYWGIITVPGFPRERGKGERTHDLVPTMLDGKTAGKWQGCESYFGASSPWHAAAAMDRVDRFRTSTDLSETM